MSPLTNSDRLREALLVLSRERFASIASRLRLEVADRRSAAAHVEAIAHADGVTVGDLLSEAKRDELKNICEKLGVESSGKEKGPILARIAAALGEKTEALTLTSPEPQELKPTKKGERTGPSPANGNGVSDYRHPEATRKNNPPAGLIEFDRLRAPADVDHRFQVKPIAGSTGSRSPIPAEVDHPFQVKPITPLEAQRER